MAKVIGACFMFSAYPTVYTITDFSASKATIYFNAPGDDRPRLRSVRTVELLDLANRGDVRFISRAED